MMMIPMIRSETKRICRQKCLGCVFKQKTNFASKENVHFCYEIISTAKDQSSLSPQKKNWDKSNKLWTDSDEIFRIESPTGNEDKLLGMIKFVDPDMIDFP